MNRLRDAIDSTIRTEPPEPPHCLVGQMSELGQEPLTIVSGPAGCGKTTLLGRWYRQLEAGGGRPTWFTLPAQQRGRPATLDFIRSTLDCGTRPISPSIDDEPETEIKASEDQTEASCRVLFLDDVGGLDRATVDHLIQVLTGLPYRERLVLAARSSILSPLAGSHATITRSIGAAALRLDDAAIADIIISYRPDLTMAQLEPAVAQIGGWAAGAHLAGHVIASHPAPEKVISTFSGRDIDVVDYFEAEIYSGLPLSDQEFLAKCSILPELRAESCSSVTGDQDSAIRLATLSQERALIARKADGLTYEWLPLAQDFLQAKLNRRPSFDVALLRDRARVWAVEAGRYGDAIDLAAEAEDWAAIIEIVLHVGLEVIGSGQSATVAKWLQALPPSVLRDEAGVAVVAAIALWVSEGDDAGLKIDDWLDHAEGRKVGGPPSSAGSLSAAIDITRAAFGSAGPRRRMALARRALETEPTLGPAWAALAFDALGTAAYADGEYDVARRAIADCLRLTASLNSDREASFGRLLATTLLGTLSLIELDAGERIRADITLSGAMLNASALPGRKIGIGTVILARSRQAFDQEARPQAVAAMIEVGEGTLRQDVRVLAYLEAAIASARLGLLEQYQSCLAAADQLLDGMTEPGRLLLTKRRAADQPDLALNAMSDADQDPLTEREHQVLALLESELSRRQMAERLFLAHNTVKTYVQRLYQKLGVSSRPAAVAEARRRGWLS